jgi:hypothetical protein
MLCAGIFRHNDTEGRNEHVLSVGLQSCGLKKSTKISMKSENHFESGAYLGESLLLQIHNDTLPKERQRADDVQHILVVVLEKRAL